jgi:hypothetical protein
MGAHRGHDGAKLEIKQRTLDQPPRGCSEKNADRPSKRGANVG